MTTPQHHAPDESTTDEPTSAARSRRRLGVGAAVTAGAVLATVGLGATVAVANANSVTLTVDGESTTVTTYADSVGELLERRGLATSEQDLVVPDESSDLIDGGEVAVTFARPVTLTVDGRQSRMMTTALSVDALLAQLDVRTNGAELSVSRSAGIGRAGLDLEIRSPKKVVLVVDGKRERMVTTGLTAAEVLQDAGYEPGKRDVLRPGSDKAIEAGATVRYDQFTIATKTKRVTVPHRTVTVRSGKLYTDQRRVRTPGQDGVAKLEVRMVTLGGERVRTSTLDRDLVRKPVTEVVVAGSKNRAPSTSARSAAAPAVSGGSVWDSLAQCESGGNWSINTGNGYYGGLQFVPSTWLAYGGGAYAALPSQASREQQIAVAERLRASSGFGSWPACSAKLGLR